MGKDSVKLGVCAAVLLAGAIVSYVAGWEMSWTIICGLLFLICILLWFVSR